MDKLACSEIICILNQLDESSRMKVPKNIIEFFENNKDGNYNCNIDLNKPLENQNLRKETIEFLCMINYEYLSNEDEKRKLYEIYKENDRRINQKQDVYEIFKRRTEGKETHQELVENKKEKLFIRVIKRLKDFLNRK